MASNRPSNRPRAHGSLATSNAAPGRAQLAVDDTHLMLDHFDDAILPLVNRPGRYVPAIAGLVEGDFRAADFTAAVVGPDLLEALIMQPVVSALYYGAHDAGGYAELAFLPAADLEMLLRRHRLPLMTLESRRRLPDFDLLLVPMVSDLQATGLLAVLELAGLALRAAERGEEAPLVVLAGPGAINPEPVAPFVDAVVLGDVEAALPALSEAGRARRQGEPRSRMLSMLADRPGIYVPELVDMVPGASGMRVAAPGTRVRTAVYTPDVPTQRRRLQPLIEVRDDALTIEVMRGCPRRCRFCQPARAGGPVRELSAERLVGSAGEALRTQGWDELALGGLMPADWSELREGVESLGRELLGTGTALSIGAASGEALSGPLLSELSRVRRTALHIAPEAGSARLRRLLGKPLDEEALLAALRRASVLGWPAVRLHFMIGLPTESTDDLLAIAELTERLRNAGKRPGAGVKLHLMVHPFVPRPQTPLQWESQLAAAEIEARLKTLRGACRRVAARIKWRRPAVVEVEGLLARGDRRVAALIEAAYRAGARLDNWSEFHRPDIWRQVIDEARLDVKAYTAARDPDAPLPWSHLEAGMSFDELRSERDKAYREAAAEVRGPGAGTPAGASGAGARREPPAAPAARRSEPPAPPAAPGRTEPLAVGRRSAYGRGPRRRRGPAPARSGADHRPKARVRFQKTDALRFISHLDVVRLIDRAFRRAELPVAYSTGFSRHPRVSFGPPLAVGLVSRDEYFDVEFTEAPAEDLGARLNAVLPRGVEVLESAPITRKVDALMVLIDHADYRVEFPAHAWQLVRDPVTFEASLHEAVETFFSRSRVVTTQRGADRKRSLELRGGVRRLSLARGGDDAPPAIDMSLRISGEGAIRPQDVATCLLGEEPVEPRLLRIERQRLYRVEDARELSPFDALGYLELSVGALTAAHVEQSPGGSFHVEGNRYQRRSRRNKDRDSRRW